MLHRILIASAALLLVMSLASADGPLPQEPNTWVKRSPLKTSVRLAPGMGYEGSLGYDPGPAPRDPLGRAQPGRRRRAERRDLGARSAHHALGAEGTESFPAGQVCAQQNVFDPISGRFLRFPAFSGSHGWHWFRENYLNNTSAWSYDLGTNTWARPAPRPAALSRRSLFSWDSRYQVVVVFGGEGSHDGTLVYDPYTNTWTRLRPQVGPPGP